MILYLLNILRDGWRELWGLPPKADWYPRWWR